MKRFFAFIMLCIASVISLSAQELNESIEIIESSIKDNIYYNFTISADGYLSYNWGTDNDNSTVITIDLANVTIAKDFTSFQPKLWINCIDGNSCIKEQGIIGSHDEMFFDYSRTYLPAKNEDDLNAMFNHISLLMKYATGR